MVTVLQLSPDGATFQETKVVSDDFIESMIILSEAMPELSCFRINSEGKAYKITANDVDTPFIDGITLESGGIGAVVSVGTMSKYLYTTSNTFLTSDIYWLSPTGSLVTNRPVATFGVVVGRSIPNSNKFLFDPQPPIRLA